MEALFRATVLPFRGLQAPPVRQNSASLATPSAICSPSVIVFFSYKKYHCLVNRSGGTLHLLTCWLCGRREIFKKVLFLAAQRGVPAALSSSLLPVFLCILVIELHFGLELLGELSAGCSKLSHDLLNAGHCLCKGCDFLLRRCQFLPGVFCFLNSPLLCCS